MSVGLSTDYYILGVLMMKVALAFLAVYLLIGAFRVWLDFKQPIINQPDYVRRRSLPVILSLFVLWPVLVWSDTSWYCRKWKIKHILKKIFVPQAANEDEKFSKIAEQIVERHNKYGVTLTDPKTGKDLLAGMTDEQREKYRQFKIKTSRIKQEEKEEGE
jgi:hypothetical protein